MFFKYMAITGIICLLISGLWVKYNPWDKHKEYSCLVTHKYEGGSRYGSRCYLVYINPNGMIKDAEVSVASYVTAKENSYATFVLNSYDIGTAPAFALPLDFLMKVLFGSLGISATITAIGGFLIFGNKEIR